MSSSAGGAWSDGKIHPPIATLAWVYCCLWPAVGVSAPQNDRRTTRRTRTSLRGTRRKLNSADVNVRAGMDKLRIWLGRSKTKSFVQFGLLQCIGERPRFCDAVIMPRRTGCAGGGGKEGNEEKKKGQVTATGTYTVRRNVCVMLGTFVLPFRFTDSCCVVCATAALSWSFCHAAYHGLVHRVVCRDICPWCLLQKKLGAKNNK